MGNNFVHMELTADNVDAAKKFYKAVFDWKLTTLGPDMGNYTMIDTGSKNTGGGLTGKMMPEAPTGWLVYAEVASVKKTMAKVEKAGGKVVVPFQPIGEMGAIGVFVDPQGSGFGVWEKAAPKPKAKKSAKKAKAAKKAKKR